MVLFLAALTPPAVCAQPNPKGRHDSRSDLTSIIDVRDLGDRGESSTDFGAGLPFSLTAYVSPLRPTSSLAGDRPGGLDISSLMRHQISSRLIGRASRRPSASIRPGPTPGAAGPFAQSAGLEMLGLERDDTIFTASARTVDFNGTAFIPRFTYFQATKLYDGSSRVKDPIDRELRVYQTTLRATYGFHEDFTVAVTLPYVFKEMEARIGGERVTRRSDGLGDLTVMGKWRFFKRPELGGTTEMAAFLGAKLPTGADDEHDGGARLPQPLQPGTGSVDGILGAALTRLWDGGRWLINADIFYKFNSKANDYRFGNVLRFDIGGHFRVYPDRYERYDQMTVNAVLELNGQYAEEDIFDGDHVKTTGGLKLFISPGIQAIVSENLLVEAGVQIPLYRNLNGPQLAEDFRATFGLRWRF